jgi:hypothetical protein
VAVFAKPQRGPNLEIEGVWAEGSQRAEIPFPRISATRRRATLPHEHARRHSTVFHRCPLGHLPWPVSRCMCEVLRPGMCFERIQSDCDPLSVSSHRFSLESCRLIVLACPCSALSCESRGLPNQALICCGGLCAVWRPAHDPKLRGTDSSDALEPAAQISCSRCPALCSGLGRRSAPKAGRRRL